LRFALLFRGDWRNSGTSSSATRLVATLRAATIARGQLLAGCSLKTRGAFVFACELLDLGAYDVIEHVTRQRDNVELSAVDQFSTSVPSVVARPKVLNSRLMRDGHPPRERRRSLDLF
jgi:hypothetical protein